VVSNEDVIDVNGSVDPEKEPNSDIAAETGTAEGTPDPSAANTRRGLRNRKPAQQRPYYHDAQLFEDAETSSEEEDSDESSIDNEYDREMNMNGLPGKSLWDAIAIQMELATGRPRPDNWDDLDLAKHRNSNDEPSKTKHFKGKGRAWKKEGSDEDEEFTPKQKKAAKAAKAKAEKARAKADKGDEKATADDIPKPKKKIGRPRKSNLSEDIVRNEYENDTSVVNGEASTKTPTQPLKRGRGRPRKSALSAEIVRDDSDEDTQAQNPAPEQVQAPASEPAELQPATTTTIDLTTSPRPKPASRPSTATDPAPASTPKKRGRPRKSSVSTTPAKYAKTTDDISISQRTASPVSKPKAARARSSVPGMPTPNMSTGEALVAAIYRSVGMETSYDLKPLKVSDIPAMRARVEAAEKAEAAAKAEAEAEAAAKRDANLEPKTDVGVETSEGTKVESVEKKPEEEGKEQKEDENMVVDDREMSASMSLSSDSELCKFSPLPPSLPLPTLR
jgi:hypothetical protein